MKPLLVACMLLSLSACATSSSREGGAHGLTAQRSPHGVKATIDRLEAAAKARGLTVFARVDHAAGAQRIGKALRPTELLIFGNPQGGTPLMECAQTVGIDLPLKALAWQDAGGAVWLGYNDPRHLLHRHRGGECQPAVDNVARALGALAAEALKP
ncbi:MAG: DUF302 domain-containing protein [Betaproteobacteria bacterium]